MSPKLKRGLAWGAGLIFLILLPQALGITHINKVVQFAIDATFAVSLNLLLGYAGLLSFGHAMFFGIGAYATALALTHTPGLPLLMVVGLGGVAGAVLALLLSPFLVRVSGTAFAMLSLAFGQLLYVFCLKYRQITRGEDGIGGYPIPPFRIPGILSVDMTVPQHFYYFAMTILLLSIGGMWFFTRTPLGSILVGIRDNPRRIDYLGFKVPHSKGALLIVSGTFAGLAGSIYALLHNLVSADGVLSIFASFNPIVMAYVGGLGSFFGPILGSGLIHGLNELTSRYVRHVDLINGLVFIGMVLFAPGGVVGIYRAAKEKWLHRKRSRGKGEKIA
jgi:branched-chain amino acid transport system permease protein